MGFNDREIVALLGAHALGRCHEDRSGYWGPWTFAGVCVIIDAFYLNCYSCIYAQLLAQFTIPSSEQFREHL